MIQAPAFTAFIGGPELILVLLFGGAALISAIISIIALVQILTGDRLVTNDKILWTLVVVLTAPIGAIIFFCVSPKSKTSS